jgi:hypothetical protein
MDAQLGISASALPRQGRSGRFTTMLSSPMAQACWNVVPLFCVTGTDADTSSYLRADRSFARISSVLATAPVAHREAPVWSDWGRLGVEVGAAGI